MSSKLKTFVAKSTIKAFDKDHRRKINFNIGKYDAAVPGGKSQFDDIENLRKKSKVLKWKAIESLQENLESFEANLTKNGGKVLWAVDANEALEHIGRICKEKNCKTVVKSKSMVTEEIHLNDFLRSLGIDSIETDLGEYIQQLDGEPPYHIVTPAMHKNKDDVAKLFSEKLGVPKNLGPAELTMIARNKLRTKYPEAEIGITGANFILPDIGGVAITENEGNARLCSALPKTHVVVVGIEKVIPTIEDLYSFWPLLSTYGTGQKVTVYNSIISGPKSLNETDGPEELYVILLDNGRTDMLANPKARQGLYCIRCGACLNACPVYKNIGGHSYGTTYSGPIGKVVTPQLKGIGEFQHLSQASSLCGRCTEVCPIHIDLHELILNNRQEAVRIGKGNKLESLAWNIWKNANLNRSMLNLGHPELKTWVINKLFSNWVAPRKKLVFANKTFNQVWKESQRSDK